MSKTLQAVCFTACLCLLAAFASAKPYISPHGGYSLTPLAGWQTSFPEGTPDVDVVVEDATRVYTLTEGGQVYATPQPYLVVSAPTRPPASLEAYKSKLLKSYQQDRANVKLISQTYSSLGGVRDLNTVFTYTEGDLLMRSQDIAVIKGGFLHVFTAVCEEKIHPQCDPGFARLLASVRWKS